MIKPFLLMASNLDGQSPVDDADDSFVVAYVAVVGASGVLLHCVVPSSFATDAPTCIVDSRRAFIL